tara:strand:+ start:1412 stop:2023 length:612 start_codon:yes stop_codon:yes gene_type:complete
MATTLDIVRGISQVLANSHDGALDEEGEPIKIGLKREEGDPIKDSRVMDGFSCRFHGNQICISYQSECRLKDVHANSFESDTEQKIEDIAKFLKKEYKKLTGSTLSLKASGEMKAIVQNVSKVRTWVQAQKYYDIGGTKGTEPVGGDSKDSVDAKFKSFLDLGGFGKKTKNDKRKEPSQGQPVYTEKGVKSRKNVLSDYKNEK